MRSLTSTMRVAALLSMVIAGLLCSPPALAATPFTPAVANVGSRVAPLRAVEPAAASCAGPTKGTGKISGKVTAAESGSPLSVQVKAYSSDGFDAGFGQSNANGDYVISNLASGTYTIEFSPVSSIEDNSAYVREYYQNSLSFTTAVPVTVTEPNTASNIDAQLERGARITGRITAADAPSQGLFPVHVTVYDAEGGAVKSLNTNEDGTYTIPGLRAGDYKVGFRPLGAGATGSYIAEFYDDKTDLASATLLSLTLGSSTTINATLNRGGQIAGKVTATTGGALQFVGVRIYDSEGNVVAASDTGEDGTYMTVGLRPGTYRVGFVPPSTGPARQFAPEFYDNKPDLASATSVAVAQGSITPNINAQIEPTGRITGKVTQASGAALAGVGIQIYDSNGAQVAFAGTAADGTYTASGLQAGTYRVRFDPSSSSSSRQFAPEFYDDKPDLASATPVAVIQGGTTPNINAQLEPGARISGKVSADNGGAPIKNVTIIVYNSSGSFVASARTADDGTYTTPGLRTGSYRIKFALVSFDVSAYAPEFYDDKPTLDQATPIQVTQPQMYANIDATLTGGGCIHGQVFAADTGDTLTDVSVTIYDAAGQYVTNVFSGAAGIYQVNGLASGDYTVEFEPRGRGILSRYATEFYHDKPSRSSATTIKVIAPNAVTNIDGTLDRGGYISGRVTATAGGVEDVLVSFYSADGLIQYARSDSAGRYRSPALRAGIYKIGFIPPTPSASMAVEYYNNKPDRASADPVTVTVQNITAGIDAALGPPLPKPLRVYLPLAWR